MVVKTDIGAKRPPFLARLFGRKGTPGMVIYVCCEDCAAKVKADPATYAYKVVAEHNGWSREDSKAVSLERVTSSR